MATPYNVIEFSQDSFIIPLWCQAIAGTDTVILLSGLLGRNFTESLIKMQSFSFKINAIRNICKMVAILSRLQCVKYLFAMINTSSPKCSLENYSPVIFFSQVVYCRHEYCNRWLVVGLWIIKSPQSGITLCFQFISTAMSTAAALTFASHVKTVWAKPKIFGTKKV